MISLADIHWSQPTILNKDYFPTNINAKSPMPAHWPLAHDCKVTLPTAQLTAHGGQGFVQVSSSPVHHRLGPPWFQTILVHPSIYVLYWKPSPPWPTTGVHYGPQELPSTEPHSSHSRSVLHLNLPYTQHTQQQQREQLGLHGGSVDQDAVDCRFTTHRFCLSDDTCVVSLFI